MDAFRKERDRLQAVIADHLCGDMYETSVEDLQAAVAEKDACIAQKNRLLAAKEATLASREALLLQKDEVVERMRLQAAADGERFENCCMCGNLLRTRFAPLFSPFSPHFVPLSSTESAGGTSCEDNFFLKTHTSACSQHYQPAHFLSLYGKPPLPFPTANCQHLPVSN